MKFYVAFLLAVGSVASLSATSVAPRPVLPVASPAPAKVTASPAATPAAFDPTRFEPITTSTLPQDNGCPIVARVNGQPVYWEAFELQAKLLGAKLFHQHSSSSANIYSALAAPAIEPLVSQALYGQFADKHNLEIQPAEIAQRTAATRANRDAGTQLVLSQLTVEQVNEQARLALVQEKVDKYIGDMATSAPPTQREISAFVGSTTPTTHSLEIVRARHIVIRATPDMSQFNLNDAKAKANEVLEKLRSGLDFITAARQSSQDRFTAYRGGDLGYFEPDTMYEAFQQALTKLKPGEISEVVRTPVGYHIIQLTERHHDDLLLQMDKHRRLLAIDQWKSEARKNATVENFLNH